MEGTPINRKFSSGAVERLRYILTENHPLSIEDRSDARDKSEIIISFLRELGYSADLKDITDLSINVRKLPLENFRKKLEEIAREN